MTYKIATISLTILLIGLVVTTYILDQHKSNWVCGPVLFFLGLVLCFVQLIISAKTLTTAREKLKAGLTILSGLILLFYLVGFINFLTNCS
jgi:Na+/phosphate symporter